MHKAHYWQKALKHLSDNDKVMKTLISQLGDIALYSRGQALETLTRSVVGQQISVQAADNVWGKVVKHLGGISTKSILSTSPDDLKSCGLSAQKVSYLQNIAKHFSAHDIVDHTHWQSRSYESIYKELIAIKGVGPWTIEMFAMFYLLEPDIFPIQDIGIIRAINQLYNTKQKSLNAQQIEKISTRWRPYRSVATWYLWRSIDENLVLY